MKTHDGHLSGTNNFVKVPSHDGQFNYLGRWVDKHTFRAFVYNEKGAQQLADSYNQFESLIATGLWFAEKPKASKERKPKNVIASSNGK